jgi:hypothetical protein
MPRQHRFIEKFLSMCEAIEGVKGDIDKRHKIENLRR